MAACFFTWEPAGLKVFWPDSTAEASWRVWRPPDLRAPSAGRETSCWTAGIWSASWTPVGSHRATGSAWVACNVTFISDGKEQQQQPRSFNYEAGPTPIITSVGVPSKAQILKSWSISLEPGNSGRNVYNSGIMQPTAHMSMALL